MKRTAVGILTIFLFAISIIFVYETFLLTENYEPKKSFTCYEGSIIPIDRLGDGQSDCQSPEREDETSYLPNSCSDGYIRCHSHACTPFSNICIMDIDPWGYYKGCRDQTHLRNCG